MQIAAQPPLKLPDGEGGYLNCTGGGIADCNFMHVQHPVIARSFRAYVKKDVYGEYGLGSFSPLFYLQLQKCSIRCDHSFFCVDDHFFKREYNFKLNFFVGHLSKVPLHEK